MVITCKFLVCFSPKDDIKKGKLLDFSPLYTFLTKEFLVFSILIRVIVFKAGLMVPCETEFTKDIIF